MNLSPEKVEEILEAIWVAKENDCNSVDEIKKFINISVDDDMLDSLKRECLVTIQDNCINLTPAGELKAKSVIRKHRLAERLMVDVLGMDEESIEKPACEFEHVLSEGVEETICTLLGHPRKCPHGADIPEGICCLEERKQIDNIITTLDNVDTGKEVKIVYISTDQHSILHKLTSYGIIPGTVVSVHQKSPTLVIQTQNLQLAIEKNIGKNITVRKFK